MNIIITGSRNCGKTTISALIAKTLMEKGQNVDIRSNSREDEKLIKDMAKTDFNKNVISTVANITIIDLCDREDESSLKCREKIKNESLHESKTDTVDREASTDADA